MRQAPCHAGHSRPITALGPHTPGDNATPHLTPAGMTSVPFVPDQFGPTSMSDISAEQILYYNRVDEKCRYPHHGGGWRPVKNLRVSSTGDMVLWQASCCAVGPVKGERVSSENTQQECMMCTVICVFVTNNALCLMSGLVSGI